MSKNNWDKVHRDDKIIRHVRTQVRLMPEEIELRDRIVTDAYRYEHDRQVRIANLILKRTN